MRWGGRTGHLINSPPELWAVTCQRDQSCLRGGGPWSPSLTVIRCGNGARVVTAPGVEWSDVDIGLAVAFFAALPEKARFIFDLLIDHPARRQERERPP